MPQLSVANYALARLKHVAGIDAAGDVHLARQLGWYNVQDYGAVGDNSTNETSAFAAAIAALPAGGGNIYVPAGVYQVDAGTITSGNKSVTIWGDGPWV